MSGYSLSKAASCDLDEISSYIAADSIASADLMLVEVHAALAMLAERPRLGHRRMDLTSADVRFWVVRSYLIVYVPEELPLQVLRVLSGFRDLRELPGSAEPPWAVGEYPPASEFSNWDLASEGHAGEVDSALAATAAD